MGPLDLQNLLTHFEGVISEINKTWMVIDDTHVVNTLGDVSLEENMFLVGLVPQYNTQGDNSDNFRTVAYGQFLILEKTDYSNLDKQQFLDVFQRTFAVAENIRNLLIEYSAEKQCEFPFLMQMDLNSLKMEPIYKLAQCNGWSLEFDM